MRLRTLVLLGTAIAFLLGLGAGALWFWSSQAWHNHLTRAYVTGIGIHEALRTGTQMPPNVTVSILPPDQSRLADRGAFSRLPDAPVPAYVTNVSILDRGADPIEGHTLSIGIVSDKLRYSLAELVQDERENAAAKFGNVTRLLATYCSDSILFVSRGDGTWARIDGTKVWGCSAVPRDLRLLSALLAIFGVVIVTSLVSDAAAHFDRFAYALRHRRRLGGPESYAISGPQELQDIVGAVNSYLETERAQLSKRAFVLSGVSHDLGMPATRLRLRTALIEDEELREKFDKDIDRMTTMIESVLTYTRSELNVEEPRQISLSSLVEAIVDDYQDMGKPVEMRPISPRVVQTGLSLFAGQRGQSEVTDHTPILVMARPISLQRAITNLVDNALKYGRYAAVEIEASSERARVTIEDAGSHMTVEDIENLMAPFQRGENTMSIEGSGLGLTIVATIAEQHGGRLYFEHGTHGLRASLEIER
jgi:signal transduction histidine kinase